MIEINRHEILITRAVFDSDCCAEELEGYYKDCKEMKLTEDDIQQIYQNYTDEEIFKEYYKGDIPAEIKYIKSPLVLVSKWRHDKLRLKSTREEIRRFIEANKEIPYELLEEYRELIKPKGHVPNIEEYAKIINKELIIKHNGGVVQSDGRNIYIDSVSVYFHDCRVIETNGSVLGICGCGYTEKEALNDYTEKIIGKKLVFHSYLNDQKEYYVSDLSFIE